MLVNSKPDASNAVAPAAARNLASRLVRATGNTTYMLRCLVLFCVVLAIAAPFAIRVLGLGAPGAIVGAGVAMASNVLLMNWLLHRDGHPLAWRRVREHVRANWPLVREVLRFGLPSVVISLSAVAAEALVLRLVNSHGTQATAGWGVATQVLAYVQFPAIAFAAAAGVFAAQAVGARQHKRLPQVTATALRLCLLVDARRGAGVAASCGSALRCLSHKGTTVGANGVGTAPQSVSPRARNVSIVSLSQHNSCT